MVRRWYEVLNSRLIFHETGKIPTFLTPLTQGPTFPTMNIFNAFQMFSFSLHTEYKNKHANPYKRTKIVVLYEISFIILHISNLHPTYLLKLDCSKVEIATIYLVVMKPNRSGPSSVKQRKYVKTSSFWMQQVL